jgi:uroporphyrinogen-III synthase
MSDPRPEPHEPEEHRNDAEAVALGAPLPPPPPSGPEEPAIAPPPQRDRSVLVGLACLVVLVVVLAGTAPFWAPALPWGQAHDEAAVQQRLDRLEAAQRQPPAWQQPLDAITATQQTLAQQVKQAQETQGAALQPLEKRLAALEQKPSVAPSDVEALRQQLGKLNTTVTDLNSRLEALDKTVRTTAANDTQDAAITLALLQISDAVETGRPFPAAYDTLASLAHDRAEIRQAAAPLAGPAKSGVATRAALASRLHELATSIATAAPKPPANDWGEAALARLRGLVTVRRIDGEHGGSSTASGGNSADAAVHEAELAVAAGNLRGAVERLDKLSGAPAEAAAPWLRMAHQRLAVEAALREIAAKVTARLGKALPDTAPARMGSAG